MIIKRRICKGTGYLLAVLISTAAQAVTPPVDPTALEPSGAASERLETPEYFDPSTPTFVLPEVKPSGTEDQLYEQIRVFVKHFEITGNSVVTSDELKEVTDPYENRLLTSAEIQEVRRNLTLYYINKGYINSGAILPDQKITDGIVKMYVIEGELTTIELDGNVGLKSDYISERLRLGSGPPLNLKDMQDQLKFLQQNPLIKKVNAQLTPGSKPGESILKVLVEEDTPYSVAIFANNYRSPSIGSYGYGLEAIHRNLTGRGDALSFRIGQTEGFNDPGVTDGALSYSIPLNAKDTTLRFKYEAAETTITEEPFEGLDITSKSDTIGIELTHPVYKTLNRDVVLGVALDKRESRSYLLGEPFPFSAGTDDGLSKVTALRLIQLINIRQLNQAFSIRSVISFGLDALGSTINDAESSVLNCANFPTDACPDSRFISWLVQFQYARRISLEDRNMSLIFRADTQLADRPLLSIEQFSVGGAKSVRGYRESELVRDNGFVASAELRIPVFLKEDGTSTIHLVPFIDYGQSWNTDSQTPDPRSLSSAGLGFLWNPDNHFRFEFYAAKAFRKIDQGQVPHDLQDDGIHMQASYRF